MEGIREPARALAALLQLLLHYYHSRGASTCLPLCVSARVRVCRCRHAIFVRRQCHGMAHRCPPVPALCMRLSEDATCATTALSIQHCDGPKRQGLRVAQLWCRREVCEVL